MANLYTQNYFIDNDKQNWQMITYYDSFLKYIISKIDRIYIVWSKLETLTKKLLS